MAVQLSDPAETRRNGDRPWWRHDRAQGGKKAWSREAESVSFAPRAPKRGRLSSPRFEIAQGGDTLRTIYRTRTTALREQHRKTPLGRTESSGAQKRVPLCTSSGAGSALGSNRLNGFFTEGEQAYTRPTRAQLRRYPR